MLPVMAIAAPAMQEDEGRIAFAADVVDDGQSVGSPDGCLRRLGVTLSAKGKRQDEHEATGQQSSGACVHSCLHTGDGNGSRNRDAIFLRDAARWAKQIVLADAAIALCIGKEL